MGGPLSFYMRFTRHLACFAQNHRLEKRCFGLFFGSFWGSLWGSFWALCRPRRFPEGIFSALFSRRAFDDAPGGKSAPKVSFWGLVNVLKVW